MRVCYIANEFFAYGIYGGFGALLRSFCRGLNARGIETYALIRRYTEEAIREQPDIEDIEGTTVVALPKGYAARCMRRDLFELPDADLYVSMEPRFDTLLAKRANPDKKHAILFGDPHDWPEFWAVARQDPQNNSAWSKWKLWAQHKTLDAFRHRAAHCVDAHFAHGHEIGLRASKLYGVNPQPTFLPNPIDVPEGPIEKAEQPTVLFLARWDLQKRPELFVRLARAFPTVRFVMAGSATDPEVDGKLRHTYQDIPNLVLPGHISGSAKDQWLRESWILVNTSVREGMPVSYLEALSYECSILSSLEADNLVSRYGCVSKDDNFANALTRLLENDRWRELGRQGRIHVEEVFEFDKAIDATVEAYRALIEAG